MVAVWARLLAAAALLSFAAAAAAAQALPSSMAGSCMHGDLFVTSGQKQPAQGNVPVQASGSHVYAIGSDGQYKEVAAIAPDLLVSYCAVSDLFIVLAVLSQTPEPGSSNPVIYSGSLLLSIFARDDAQSTQWKQTQQFSQVLPSTSGILQTSVSVTDSTLVVTSQTPNPLNSGSVSIYSLSPTGLFSLSQPPLTGSIDIYSNQLTFLEVSLFGDRLAVSGFPGVASNTSSATNVYVRGADGKFAFESETPKPCANPVLGKGGLLAASTSMGIDLYLLGADGKYSLADSLVSPGSSAELRGTKSLAMSPDGSRLVRGVGPYDYSSSTGCVVYKIASGKVSLETDSYGAAPLTVRCAAGATTYAVSTVDQTTSLVSANMIKYL